MSREKKEEKRLTHFKTMPQAAGKKSVYAHPNMEGRIADNPLGSRMPIDMHRPQVASMFVQSKKVGRAISKTTQLINYLFKGSALTSTTIPTTSLTLFIIHFVKS